MKMQNILALIYLLLLTFSYNQSVFKHYPEEITSLDYLVYSDNEWLLSAFYFSDPAGSSGLKKFDFRNGIIVYPHYDCAGTSGTSTILADIKGNNITPNSPIKYTYSDADTRFWNSLGSITDQTCDTMWDETGSVSSTIVPRFQSVVKNYITSSTDASGDLICAFYLGNALPNGVRISDTIQSSDDYTLKYYIWLFPQENCDDNPIFYKCATNQDSIKYTQDFQSSIEGPLYILKPKFIQETFSIKPKSDGKYTFSTYNISKSDCLSKDGVKEKLYISISGTDNGRNSCTTQLHYLKVTLKYKNNSNLIIKGTTCISTESNPCPPNYYCNVNRCDLCHGSCYTCTGPSANDCSTCSPFSKQWQLQQTPCTLEYYDMSVYSKEYIFTDIPPIKTGMATLSFWMYYSRKDITNSNVAHIIVEDNLMLTIAFNSSKIENYCSVYQMYHDKMGDPYSQMTRTSFTNLLKTEPISGWYISNATDNLEGKWFYTRCAVNYHTNSYYISNLYKTSYPYNLSNSCGISSSKSGTFDFEFTHTQSYKSEVHFNKFYRPDDKIKVKIKGIHNLGASIFIRNLYVFAEFIPESMTNIEYFNLHKFVDKNEFPQFIFASPFDYFDQNFNMLYYYVEPFSSQIAKTISLGSPSTGFTFPRNFYRINLLSEGNKVWNTTDVDPSFVDSIPCTNFRLYCFDEDKAFACEQYFYLNTNDYSCDSACPYGMSIASGLPSALTAYCNQICTNCIIYSDPKSFDCEAGYIKMFDKCISETDSSYPYTTRDWRGALYYSYFFNLPTLYISLDKINNDLIVSDSIVEFYWLFEPNDYLRPPSASTVNNIFYTNTFNIYHDDAIEFYIRDNTDTSTPISSSLINLYNWNKFTIVTKGTSGKVYVNNNFSTNISFSAQSVSYIVFCNKDPDCPPGDSIVWSGGYYRKIRMWNSTKYDVNVNMVYNYQIYDNVYWYKKISELKDPFINRPKYIDLEFFLNLKNIASNTLTDALESSYSINLNTSLKSLNDYNLENMKLYNFSSNFDIVMITATLNKYVDDTSTLQTCNSKCLSCWSSLSSTCNTVDETLGYFKDSTSTAFPTTNKSYYVFVSPTLSNKDVVLKAAGLGTKQTVSFYIKIIGFQNNDKSDIILFGTNLKLYYDHTTKYLVLYKSDTDLVLATVPDFYLKFGSYVHISIAYQYDPDQENHFPPILNFIVDRVNIKINYVMDELKLINFNVVTLSSTLFATIAQLFFYDNFYVGIYGYQTNTSSNLSPYYIAIDSSVGLDFSKVDATNGLVNSDIVNYLDYDLYFNSDKYSKTAYTEGSISTPATFYLVESGIATDDNNCSIGSQVCYEYCYGSSSSECACKSDSDKFILLQINDTTLQCKNLDYLDFASFSSVSVTNVKSSEKSFTIEFWMYFYNYYTEDIGPFNILWDKQLKISIEFKSSILSVTCFPSYDSEDSTSYTDKFSLDITSKKWNYIRCSVNRDIKKFVLLSDSNFTPGTQTFTSYPNVSDPTNLKFEDSTGFSSWGVLFFRQIRLWKCYTCENTSIYNMLIKDKASEFSELLHVFDPFFNPTYTISDIKKVATDVNASRRSNFYGYNSFKEVNYNLDLCPETDSCYSIIKLNDFDNMTFPNLPVSNWGRYTMEFWMMLTDVTKLDKGVNIIWSQHLAITIILDINQSDLRVVCFPQDYLDSPVGKSGSAIYSLIKTALNSDFLLISDKSKVWIRVRCAVSWDQGNFYLAGDNTFKSSKTLRGEVLYQGRNNLYPFRYFFHENDTSSLVVENASLNLSGNNIYFRTINLFSEYLPSTFDFKYALLLDIDSTLMPPIVFKADFLGLSLGFDNFDYWTSLKSSNSITPVVANSVTPSYDKSVVVLLLCKTKIGKKYNNGKCEDLSSCDANATICYDDNKPLFCKNNFYLDPSTNTCSDTCPNNLIRSPGSNPTNAICNLQCKNHANCNFTSTTIKDYPTNLKCATGYTRIGYNCFKSLDMLNSSFIFNRCYNFPSIYGSFDNSLTTSTENGYAIEFWYKIDNVNEFCNSIRNGTKKYFFYSVPHTLFQLTPSTKMTYENTADPAMTADLTNFNRYEWNSVLIVVNKVGTTFTTKIYTNLNLKTPDLKFDSTIDQNLLGIAFCSKNGKCNPAGKGEISIEWGAAYYKNLRIYNINISSETLNDYIRGNIYGLSKDIVHSYTFDTTNEDLNQIVNIIADKNHILYSEIYKSGNLFSEDKPLLFNFATNYDWNEFNPGKSLTNVTSRTGLLSSLSCNVSCSKCYESKPDKCYGCRDGYILDLNSTCVKANGYYLQVPSKSGKTISIKITDPTKTPPLNLSSKNGITITFWIKFWGFTNTSNSICPFIIKLNEAKGSQLCADSNMNLILKHDNRIIITENNFNIHVGKWVFIGISNFYSGQNDIYNQFANFLEVYLFNKQLEKDENNHIDPPGIKIDSVELGNEILAQYADLRFYNHFYHQPYGLVMDSSMKNQENLVLQILLFSSSKTKSCIKDQDLATNTVVGLDIICQPDNHPYLDKSNQCLSTQKYFDINLFQNGGVPCVSCDKSCTSNDYYCAGSSKLKCTCNNYDGRTNWLRVDKATNEIYCEIQPYVDVSSYSKISSDKVSLATSNEYTLEFWFYIHSYKDDVYGFDSHEIIWDLHTKARIYNENNTLKMECYPNYNDSDKNSVTSSIHAVDESGLNYHKWNVVYCSASLIKKKYFVNNVGETVTQENLVRIDSFTNKSTTTFMIQPTQGSKINYGFMYIREIKLWSIYNKKESFSCFYSRPDKYPQLLNYFPFDTNDVIFFDEVSKIGGKFVGNNEYVGYNYIDKENKYDINNIKFTLPNCPFLNLIPQSGYYQVTNFLLQCDGDSKLFTNLKYNFGYSIPNASQAVESKNYIKQSSSQSETIYSFNDKLFNQDSLDIDVFCEILSNTNSDPMVSTYRLKLYRNIMAKEFNYPDIVTGLELLSPDMDEEKLLRRAILLGSLSANFYPSNEMYNTTSVVLSFDKSSYVLKDPTCNSDFCNGKGDCIIIDKYLSCKCFSGYYGNNCQLSEINALFLEDQYLLSWRSLTYDNEYSFLNGKFSDTKFLTTTWLISGASKFIFSDTFYNQFWNLLFYLNEEVENSLLNNIDSLFETMNNLLTNFLQTTNKLKIKNANANTSTNRNLTLTEEQKMEMINSFTYLKNSMEGLLHKYIKNIKLNRIWKFYSFELYIQLIDSKSFSFTEFFKNNIDQYRPYFDAQSCLNKIKAAAGSDTFWFTFIDYKINPLLFNTDYYTNSVSDLYTIYFSNLNGDKLDIKDCTETIQIYFPFYTYDSEIIDYFNKNTYMYFPNSTLDYMDDYIISPKYVEDNGTVLDLNQLSRVRQYHRNFNLSCNYFDESISKFSVEGIAFFNLSNFYIQCNSTHLSTFLPYVIPNPINYYLDGAFFYLKYPQVFKCTCNYVGNYCFYAICGVFGSFILLLLLFTAIDVPNFAKEKLLEYLKFQILREKRRYAPKKLVYAELLKINRFSSSYVDNDELSISSIVKKSKSRNKQNTDNDPPVPNSLEFNKGQEEPEILKLNYLNNENDDAMDIDLPALDDEMEREVRPRLTRPIYINNLVNIEKNNNYERVPNIIKKKSLNSMVNEFNIEEEQEIEYPEILASEIFCKNITHRHLFISAFTYKNIYHPRYRKITLLFCLISLMMLINTLIYTTAKFFDLKELTTSPVKITDYIIYGVIVAAVSNLIILIFIPLYRINPKSKNRIFEVAKSGQHVKLLYDWEMLNNGTRTGSIIGIIINLIIMLFSFYFTFVYCSVITSMQLNLMIGLGVAIGIDFFVLEILMEFIIFLFYACRKKRFFSSLYKCINYYRDYRTLM